MLAGWLLGVTAAHAVSPEPLQQRLRDADPLRAMRLDTEAPPHAEEVYLRALDKGVQTGTIDVPGSTVKGAWGVGVFDVSIGQYWAAISDDIGKTSYTRQTYGEVLEGERCQSPRRVFQFVPVPLASDRWWVSVQQENPAVSEPSGGQVREQTWATDGDFTVPTATAQAWADKGIPPASTRGSWWLVALDEGHTLVEYCLRVASMSTSRRSGPSALSWKPWMSRSRSRRRAGWSSA